MSIGYNAQTTSQLSVLSILGGGGQSSISNINTVSNALSAAPGAPPLATIQNLLSSLQELIDCQQEGCASATVAPDRLAAAVKAYNATIMESNIEFLSNPPAELLAIQAALAQLVKAANS